jgi:hypothetical protein
LVLWFEQSRIAAMTILREPIQKTEHQTAIIPSPTWVVQELEAEGMVLSMPRVSSKIAKNMYQQYLAHLFEPLDLTQTILEERALQR